MKRINLPFTAQIIADLKAGDELSLSGIVYTARDAAHKRLCELLEQGKKLPIELTGATIYYAGPAPTPPGAVIGSIGPTTSYRMDAYAPRLLQEGLAAMIGKGPRSQAVKEAVSEHKALYLAAAGGVAAFMAQKVLKAELIAWPELLAEAIYQLVVEDFPVIVAYDCYGGDLFFAKEQKV